MAEYSKEKLYFVKLPADFFQGHRMRVLESIPSGKDYELIYLKLICESVSHNGYLRFSEDMPYTAEMIAAITGATVNEVNGALIALEKFELIQKTEDDSIFIPAVQKMTGITTEGAQRKQEQLVRRSKGGQEVEKIPPESGQEVEKIPPDIRYKSIDTRELDTRLESIDTTDKTDKTDISDIRTKNEGSDIEKIIVPSTYTKKLVECGYIFADSPYIEDYNNLLHTLSVNHSSKVLDSVLRYFIAHNRDGKDANGQEITDKFAYFSKAIFDGINKVNRLNDPSPIEEEAAEALVGLDPNALF